jgi:hypothetical protein
MSLTVRRPRHASRTAEPVEQPDQVALLRAEVERLTAERDLARRAAEHWGQRATAAETTLRNLPAALANPDALIRSLYAEREEARAAAAAARSAAIAEAAVAVLNTRGPLIHRDSTYAAYDAVRRVGDPNAPSIHDEPKDGDQ